MRDAELLKNLGFGALGDLSSNLVKYLKNNKYAPIFFTKEDGRFMHGARTIVRVNGLIVGFCFSVSWNISYDVNPIYTIDSALPADISTNLIRVSGTLSHFRVPENSLSSKFMAPTIDNFSLQPYISIEVRDSKTDSLLFYTNNAFVVSISESHSAESISRVLVNWIAIGYKDEQEKAIFFK